VPVVEFTQDEMDLISAVRQLKEIGQSGQLLVDFDGKVVQKIEASRVKLFQGGKPKCFLSGLTSGEK